MLSIYHTFHKLVNCHLLQLFLRLLLLPILMRFLLFLFIFTARRVFVTFVTFMFVVPIFRAWGRSATIVAVIASRGLTLLFAPIAMASRVSFSIPTFSWIIQFWITWITWQNIFVVPTLGGRCLLSSSPRRPPKHFYYHLYKSHVPFVSSSSSSGIKNNFLFVSFPSFSDFFCRL